VLCADADKFLASYKKELAEAYVILSPEFFADTDKFFASYKKELAEA